MPVIERFEDPGQFVVNLDPDRAPTPDVLDQIVEFGHVVITDQWFQHPDMFSEANLLAAARYAGPVLEVEWGTDQLAIRGAGMVWHLGSDQTAPIIAAETAFSGDTLDTVLAQTGSGGILPPAITAGTITTTGLGTYTGTFYPGERCIDAVRTVMSALDAHFRVNPDGTLDACSTSRDDVYTVTSPTHISVRRGFGSDPNYRGIETERQLTRRDSWGWASRGVIRDVAYDGSASVPAFKDISSNSYYDIHGNSLIRNVVFSRPSSDDITVDTFLTRELDNFTAFDEQEITTKTHLTAGDARVGDMVYVYDPPSGFIDTSTEVSFRGMKVWPATIRLIRDRWDLKYGMGVYYRPGGSSITTADWIDLTRYVLWEA